MAHGKFDSIECQLVSDHEQLIWKGQPKPTLVGYVDVIITVIVTIFFADFFRRIYLIADMHSIVDWFLIAFGLLVWAYLSVLRIYFWYSRLKNTRYLITDCRVLIHVNSWLEKSIVSLSIDEVKESFVCETKSLSTLLLKPASPVMIHYYRMKLPSFVIALESLVDADLALKAIQDARKLGIGQRQIKK